MLKNLHTASINFPESFVYGRKGDAELGRRIKKVAYEWSDKGVTKVARIILKRFTNAGAWEDYWQKRTQIIGNVVIGVGNYKCVSQNLGQ